MTLVAVNGIDHVLAPADGGVTVRQVYEVRGPMSIVYRLLAPGIRSTAHAALAGLVATLGEAPRT